MTAEMAVLKTTVGDLKTELAVALADLKALTTSMAALRERIAVYSLIGAVIGNAVIAVILKKIGG